MCYEAWLDTWSGFLEGFGVGLRLSLHAPSERNPTTNVLYLLKTKIWIQTRRISFDFHADTPEINVSMRSGSAGMLIFGSNFSQSIIISPLSEKKEFLSVKGINLIFKQFE